MRNSNPAPHSSNTETAICTTASALRSPAPCADDARLPDIISSTSDTPVACRAGAAPNAIATTNAVTAQNASTRPSNSSVTPAGQPAWNQRGSDFQDRDTDGGAGGAAEQRKHEAFSQQLSNDSMPPRAQRRPYRQLTPPRCCPREQQVRDVSQHMSNTNPTTPSRRNEVSRNSRPTRASCNGSMVMPRSIHVGPLSLDNSRNAIHVGLRLLAGRARCEPANDAQEMRNSGGAAHERRVENRPDIAFCDDLKTGWHDADDRELTIERDRAPRTLGSLSSLVRQNPSLMTTTLESARSSWLPKVRPTIGFTPRTSKNRAVTNWESSCSPVPSAPVVARLAAPVTPAINSNEWFRSLQATNSNGATTLRAASGLLSYSIARRSGCANDSGRISVASAKRRSRCWRRCPEPA